MSPLVWLVLLVALLGVFLKRRVIGEAATPILYTLVIIIFVLQSWSLFRASKKPGFRFDTEFHMATGYAIGQAVAAAFPDGGEALVVGAEPIIGEFMKKVVTAQMEGLRKGIGGGGIRLVTAKAASGGGGPEDEDFLMDGFLPGDRYLELLRQAPAAKAVISLRGMPYFKDAPTQPLPPLFVIGGDMLGEGVGAGKSGLRAAVLYRPDADWTARPASGATLEEIFAMRYRLCTAAEIAAEAAREMADAGGSHSDAEPAPVPTPKLPKD